MKEIVRTSRFDQPEKPSEGITTFLPGKKNQANSAERLFWPENRDINEVEMQKKL